MTRSTRALAVLATAGVAVAGSLAGSPPPAAHAEPVNKAVLDTRATPPIGWAQLGMSDRMELIGANQPAESAIPVPDGVGPGTLSGRIGSVVNVANGRVEVIDGRGIVLGSFPAPADGDTTPFSVNISPAQVVDDRARVSFVLREPGRDANSCTQPPALTLTQLANTFSGPTPDPVSVAGFLPGYLDEIAIRVGSAPTAYEQQAALDLVAELTHLYRPMPVRIGVTTAAALPPAAGARRVIDIRDGATPGITITDAGTPAAALLIAGTGEKLLDQVELFTDQRVKLAQSSTAAVLSSDRRPEVTSTVKTFDQLGITGQTSVLGNTVLYAGFDVSAFGVGPVTRADVHIKAKYTPVVGGEASVLIRSAGTVVATHTLDESGSLDVSATIPAEAITSNVGLALELRYIPRQECAPLTDRLTFALDPQSTVSVTPGTNNRGGFPVLPMAFTPDFDVTLNSPDRIGYAAQAINLMGQQTAMLLRPHLTSLDEALGSRTALLAVVDGPELIRAGMAPPLAAESPDRLTVDGSTSTEVDFRGPVGSLQAFSDRGRIVLAVSGGGDWSLLDESFRYIRGLPDRWASLSGDVVATGAAGETVNLTVAQGGPMAHQPAPGQVWQVWAWLSAAVVGLAALAAGGVLAVRYRRSRGRA
ncbi:hypothetical protein [Mycolicibacterium baixiangningiae]|uniref:hypothetical protein n=1 Tax=Mycolicibacterium baixiangningiae TaxID=2761578 RepID=UPI0018671D60|nr:hypothetical protein [Mycolicibacterium baixiangningiae]